MSTQHTKQELWKLIENYRMSGGREEHWRNRDLLDIKIDALIAIESDLLEALKELVDEFDWNDERANKARAAIAKAEGGAA